jgi:hypothetical protein
LKIGLHEFEAEGPEAFIEKHLDRWQAAIEAKPIMRAATVKEMRAVEESEPDESQADEGNGPAVEGAAVFEDGIPKEQIARVIGFDDKRGTIRLRAIPQNAPDAVVLVLYGALRLRGEDEVPATRLAAGLESSGVTIGRIDREAAGYLRQRLITRYGKGKGGRYRITTTGMVRAAEVVRELLGQLA